MFFVLKFGIICAISLSFLFRLCSHQVFSFKFKFTLQLPNLSLPSVFDECLTSLVVFAGGKVRCCPFNPIFCLYFFLEAIKFKVWLTSLLMPFHLRFLLFHSLLVIIYLAIVTFSSCFCLRFTKHQALTLCVSSSVSVSLHVKLLTLSLSFWVGISLPQNLPLTPLKTRSLPLLFLGCLSLSPKISPLSFSQI